MVDPVKVEISKEDAKKQSDSQKLDFLIDIAFSNHQTLSEQGKIIYGNGSPKSGLCYKVAFQSSILKWIMGLFSVTTITVVGILVKHLG
jgi:hypothetical protein